MDLRILTEEMAREVCTWHYEGIYAVYDFADWDVVVQNCWSLADAEEREANFIGFYVNDEMIGFGRIEFTDGKVQLGIGLHPDQCGKGYGMDCMNALVKESFCRYGHNVTIGLEVRRFNKRAIKCYEKCNFTTKSTYMKETLHGFIAYNYMEYEGTADEHLQS